jgi:hypothetical protein
MWRAKGLNRIWLATQNTFAAWLPEFLSNLFQGFLERLWQEEEDEHSSNTSHSTEEEESSAGCCIVPSQGVLESGVHLDGGEPQQVRHASSNTPGETRHCSRVQLSQQPPRNQVETKVSESLKYTFIV